ncbi:Indole-3-glycerol phosphate synthase [Anaerovibrio sp. JC8]|uniref:indole-3-glycerol phosphate synthase TrpC n=1 Tax=Anaerovibrio sp. JC8 TaxID=1240085 RepID=UPI000A0A9DF4|nr:indole-3-glycerol phosphate synthase TrpC [Anaerovibrio sp. JC8]ORU00777.1 Indole-3-glycerol phosphate synthase [Anaerovibrio sp. JC8]
MRDYLAEIVAKKRDIVEDAKRKLPLKAVKEQAEKGTFAMCSQFQKRKWNLIAECKLQSPSKGNFGHPYSVLELARMYEQNGASMLSIHTDPHFLGKNEDLVAVRKEVKLPLLRKEFIIDEYQIYEARMLGADAILLIARILTQQQLDDYLKLAWDLGMDALLEVHDREDIDKAMKTPAKFIGINNRNLQLFKTTIDNTLELLPYVDRSRTIISESGIHSMEEVRKLHEAGLDGILVGEGLSTAKDVGKTTRDFALLSD